MSGFICNTIDKYIKNNQELYYTEEILTTTFNYIFGSNIHFLITEINIIKNSNKKQNKTTALEVECTLDTNNKIDNYEKKLFEINELFEDCFFIDSVFLMSNGRAITGGLFYKVTVIFYIKSPFNYDFFNSYARLMRIK